MVFHRGGAGRQRQLTIVGAAIYAFFLFSAPFEHHDFICHLKNPQHCTSCAASQLGSDPQPISDPGASNLADAGRAITIHLIAAGALLPVRSTGRSPPIHA